MKNYLKIIIYIVSFIIIILLAVLGYNFLTKNYSPEEINIKNNEYKLNKAKDFEVLNNKGEKVNLSDFFGKPIVVNFWATWCMPCKNELPEFNEAYKKYGKDVEFLMVNLTDGYNDTEDSVKQFVKENNYEFPLYFDTEYSASNTYNIYSIPKTLFIDKNGDVFKLYTGMLSKETLEKYIENLKGE